MLSRIEQRLWSLCVCWGLLTAAAVADDAARKSTANPQQRPNIVFFLSDDHRADCLGCAGHEILKTPVIDRLAANGVRFENAFVTTSICAASRATLFTGLWERTHRYTFRTPPLARTLIERSYPVLLRQAGYRTGFVGKFGVGVPRGAQQEMFDYYRPLNRNPYFKQQSDGSRRHLTDLEGDAAIEFVKTVSKEQPFCLSVSFNAAHAEDSDKLDHYPWAESENGLYEDAVIPPPEVDTEYWKQLPGFFHNSEHRKRWFWRWDTPKKYQKNVKAYYRMITGLDRNIGRVLEALAKAGLAENTVVIFTGDNGYYKGNRGFAGKWSHYEESLRVPLVIYDPRLPQMLRGRVVTQSVLNVDIAPTILACAGVAVPESYQGASLVPLVLDETPQAWRSAFFCEHLMDYEPIPKWEGVRGKRYKYARYFEHLPEGEFLHDVKDDPQELKNLATDPAYADVLAKMRSKCDQLRDEVGGPYRPHQRQP